MSTVTMVRRPRFLRAMAPRLSPSGQELLRGLLEARPEPKAAYPRLGRNLRPGGTPEAPGMILPSRAGMRAGTGPTRRPLTSMRMEDRSGRLTSWKATTRARKQWARHMEG